MEVNKLEVVQLLEYLQEIINKIEKEKGKIFTKEFSGFNS